MPSRSSLRVTSSCRITGGTIFFMHRLHSYRSSSSMIVLVEPYLPQPQTMGTGTAITAAQAVYYEFRLSLQRLLKDFTHLTAVALNHVARPRTTAAVVIARTRYLPGGSACSPSPLFSSASALFGGATPLGAETCLSCRLEVWPVPSSIVVRVALPISASPSPFGCLSDTDVA